MVGLGDQFLRAGGHSAPAPVNRIASAEVIDIDELPHASPVAYAGQGSLSPWEQSFFDGGKFAGGFGITQLQIVDYPTLRARSTQLFTENIYARGLIRRLVTNEIGTGLTPESCPDEEILGLDEGDLLDWTEGVENRFNIWCKIPTVCDWRESDTFYGLQAAARLESLVGGDVLRVTRRNPRTGMPKVQLISGSKVMSPTLASSEKRDIRHGVELDTKGRHIAYWVLQDDGDIKRIPAFGRKSGRRIAELIYGTDKRYDDVRGQPLLALVLQSLKEIDRYRDAAARKAVINSILAMYIKKGEDKMGTGPTSGGAVRKGQVTTTTSSGSPRTYNIASQIPGVVHQELQHGEEPVGFNSQGIDINFGAFEEAMIQTVAWANEVPPEILTLGFSSNYSASQAAINEFKMYLDRVWMVWGDKFCTPVFDDWLISELLQRKIEAPGLLESWRDESRYETYGAWKLVEWYGSVKPSTKLTDQTKGSKMLVEQGWSTNAREARALTGTKFSKNTKRLKRENEQLVDAMSPIWEAEAKMKLAAAPPQNQLQNND